MTSRCAVRGAFACLLGAFLLIAAGCGSDGGARDPVGPSPTPSWRPPGDSVVPAGFLGLRSGDLLRLYRLHLPDPAPPGPYPLVVALHGYSDEPLNFERATGFSALADREGFAVVYPKGYQAMWNAGGPYEEWSYHTDDVAFVGALLDTLLARYPIDRGRVFVTGHSNGAHMTYRLGHALGQRLAAIAPVAGLEFAIRHESSGAGVAVLHLHALDDLTVPFTGHELGGATMLSVEAGLLDWVRLNAGDAQAQTVFDSAGVVGRRWPSTRGWGDVLLYTSTRGGHTWPTSEGWGLAGSELIWSFFRATPRRQVPD